MTCAVSIHRCAGLVSRAPPLSGLCRAGQRVEGKSWRARRPRGSSCGTGVKLSELRGSTLESKEIFSSSTDLIELSFWECERAKGQGCGPRCVHSKAVQYIDVDVGLRAKGAHSTKSRHPGIIFYEREGLPHFQARDVQLSRRPSHDRRGVHRMVCLPSVGSHSSNQKIFINDSLT